MKILYELVTVIREQKPICHWEKEFHSWKFFSGKAADVMIYKPGDLPECCTETFVSDHE